MDNRIISVNVDSNEVGGDEDEGGDEERLQLAVKAFITTILQDVLDLNSLVCHDAQRKYLS